MIPKHILMTVVAIIATSCIFYNKALAADLTIFPESEKVTFGQNFYVLVYVNSDGISINNAEGVISFPKDKLSVTSIDTTGSIFSLWVEQPSFSNTEGRISWNGGLPNPGYTGEFGRIMKINMKALSGTGTAPLSFISGNVRANDGLGTEVMNSKLGTTISLSPKAPASTQTKSAPVQTTKISTKPTTLTADDISVQTYLTKYNLLQISISATKSPAPVISYEISLDNSKVAVIETEKGSEKTFSFKPMPAGNHTITVKAKDDTGATTEKTVTFETPEPKTAEIMSHQSYAEQGNTIVIAGKSPVPDSQLTVWISEDSGEAIGKKVKTDEDGVFFLETKAVTAIKQVTVWTEVNLSDSISITSEKINIPVVNAKPSAWNDKTLGFVIIAELSLMIVILSVILAFSTRRHRHKRVRP